jgi:hypothetical protein
MDLLGLTKDDLIEGLEEPAGATSAMLEAQEAVTLFIYMRGAGRTEPVRELTPHLNMGAKTREARSSRHRGPAFYGPFDGSRNPARARISWSDVRGAVAFRWVGG